LAAESLMSPIEKLRTQSTLAKHCWIAAGITWAVLSCGGMALLTIYANTPTKSLAAPVRWPVETQIELSENRATLVMFAHPQCPCTRASLGELERIVSRFEDRLTAWVVFFTFDETDARWHQTDLRSTAEAIAGVRIMDDPGGQEAQRFNATVSGQTVLYNLRGELLFSGGITMARGHEGDNSGRSAIEALLSGAEPSQCHTAVFGCPISPSSP